MTGKSHIPINLFHILFVAPLFLYVAFVRGQLPSWIFQALLGLGIVVGIYHLYSSIMKWRAASPSLWINLIHVLFVAPLLIFIGTQNYDTPRWAFEVLAMASFATFGYHLYSIVQALQMKQEQEDH